MKNLTKLFLGTVSLAGMLGIAAPAIAQEAAAAPPAAPAPAPVAMPPMGGPLTNNPAPFSLDAVPGWLLYLSRTDLFIAADGQPAKALSNFGFVAAAWVP